MLTDFNNKYYHYFPYYWYIIYMYIIQLCYHYFSIILCHPLPTIAHCEQYHEAVKNNHFNHSEPYTL